MKKTVLILSAIAMVTFTSCGKEKAEEAVTATENAVEETAEAVEETVDEATAAVTGVPSFDNAELQDYVNTYESYFEDYKEAMESMDMTKVQELNTKGQELVQKSQSFTDISTDDAKKLSEYMEVKAKEMQDIAMKATGQ